jgi:hypothetical protein
MPEDELFLPANLMVFEPDRSVENRCLKPEFSSAEIKLVLPGKLKAFIWPLAWKDRDKRSANGRFNDAKVALFRSHGIIPFDSHKKQASVFYKRGPEESVSLLAVAIPVQTVKEGCMEKEEFVYEG